MHLHAVVKTKTIPHILSDICVKLNMASTLTKINWINFSLQRLCNGLSKKNSVCFQIIAVTIN